MEKKANIVVAKNIGEFLVHSRFVQQVEVYFRWDLIKQDVDDNKFVDCAIASNAEFIVSNDMHFQSLKEIDFPVVEVISMEEFANSLK